MFSSKIILAGYAKKDGSKAVYLQVIIDRRAVRIPLGFYIQKADFDGRMNCIKATHKNSETFNTELIQATARANTIASIFRLEKKKLTPAIFKDEYLNPSDEVDLIKYIKNELGLRKPDLAPNTIKQHNTVINKLTAFQPVIRFGDIDPSLMQRFKNHLTKENGSSTVNKLLKIVKQYLDDARKKNLKFLDPFVTLKIKTFKSNRLSLSESEVKAMDNYYESNECPPNHKKLLRYFLFSCFTGIRISDIGVITWNQIHEDFLTFKPEKTKYNGETVTIPITSDRKYLPKYTDGKRPIFETFSFPVSNRLLKDICKHLKINKRITYHTSRHTCASLFAEKDGNIPALQQMMGHGDIKTTMGYVHTNSKNLMDAKKKVFGK